MEDLVTWLRAQLDEDERLAKTASERAWPSRQWRDEATRPSGPVVIVGSDADDVWEREVSSPVWTCDDPEDGCMDIAAEWAAEAEHIARHDPARVLREVESKRRMLDIHGGGADPCDAHDASFRSIPCDTLRLLAEVYGYDEEPAHPEG